MSKIIDSLKKAAHIRSSNSVSNKKSNAILPTIITSVQETPYLEMNKDFTEPDSISEKSKSPKLIIVLLIAACFLLLLAVNLGLLKNYTQASTITATKLGRLEELLNKNNQQLTAFSDRIKEQANEIKKLNQQTKESQGLISLMEKNSSVQRTSIENLTKAKNSTYKKIEDLYKEIDALKSGNSATK